MTDTTLDRTATVLMEELSATIDGIAIEALSKHEPGWTEKSITGRARSIYKDNLTHYYLDDKFLFVISVFTATVLDNVKTVSFEYAIA